jgi:cyanophycinase
MEMPTMPGENGRARMGRLLVIGGAEDPNEKDLCILPHLVKMAGGKNARVMVCSSPSESPEEKVRTYGKLFEKIGVA